MHLVAWIVCDFKGLWLRTSSFKNLRFVKPFPSLISNFLTTSKWYVPTRVTYMAQFDTNAPAFLLQPAQRGVSCPAHYKQRMSCVFRLILLATAKHREEKDITCIKKPHHFRLCPHLKDKATRVSKGSLLEGSSGWRQAEDGGLDGMVMGGYERLNPLWINLSWRLLRLVRLGWSHVCYAWIWRTGLAVARHPQYNFPDKPLLPPFVVLTCFPLTRSKARGNSPQ